MPIDDDIRHERMRDLVRALLTDPSLGHGADGFHVIESWPEASPNLDDLLAEGISPGDIVMIVNDEDGTTGHQDVPGVRVVSTVDGAGEGAALVRIGGPFDSVLAALSDDRVRATLRLGRDPLQPDDLRLLDEIDAPVLRESVETLLRARFEFTLDAEDDLTPLLLEAVTQAFPDHDVVVQFAGDDPVGEVEFCVIRAADS